MGETIRKCAPEPPSAGAVAAKLVDAPYSTLSKANLFKDEVETDFLDKVKMNKWLVKPVKAVEENNIKVDD